MDNAILYTSNFFSWVYRMLTGFVIIPDVLTLFDIILYSMIVSIAMRFIFGTRSNS